MSTKIDSLELEIVSNSKSAVAGIDALTQSLGKLKSAAGKLGLSAVVDEISLFNKTDVSGVKSKADTLAKAVSALATLPKSNLSGYITPLKNLPKVLTGLGSVDMMSVKTTMEEVANSFKPLETVGRTSIPSAVNAMKKLPEVLENIDTRALYTKIQSLTRIFKPLADEMDKVAKGFSAMPSKIQKLIKETEKIPKSNEKAASSFTDLYHRLSSVANTVIRGGRKIGEAVEESMDYTENMNLFTVSMGEYASEAYAYAEKVSDAMGIDTSEWIRAQGVFMTLATGFGIAGDRANTMSKSLTQLSYDLSSFYNLDINDAMTKVKSGLAGELEPLRAIGYDLSQAKLEAIAVEQGITKSVSAMTQAEKAQLRYIAIMSQVTQTHGDMARTLEDPANQVRVFKAQLNMAAREIGNMFIPALNAVIPYATAVAKVIGEIASTIASLFGHKDKEVEDSTSKVVESTDTVTQNLSDAQEEAKKLKSYMLGFDELNVINPNEGSAEDTSGWVDFELPSYMKDGEDTFMSGLVESKMNTIVEKMKEWLGITKDIKSWSDLLHTNFGNILVSVGLIAVGLATWKITTGFSNLIKNLPKVMKALSGLTGLFKAIGIAAVVAVAWAGADWLLKNTDTTMEKVGAVVSAAALGVGALLAFTGINIPLGIGLMAVGAVSMGSAIAMNTTKLSDEVKGVVAIITTAVSGALLALGAILAFTGVNIPLGIALMAGGALAMATVIAPNWGTMSESVQNSISDVMGILGVSSLAIGGILAFSGANVPLGIGLMLVGALSLGTAIAINWNTISEALQGPVGGITALIGTAVLALGGLLAFSGANIPLGIALMVVGAASLATVSALNWNSVKDALQGPVGGITALIATAMLALGGVLAFSGTNIPLGIALMVVGAAGLATVVALNWNSIVDTLRGPVGDILTVLSTSMLVLGGLLLFSGANIPLGLGLMIAGAATLATVMATNWDTIGDTLKKVFGTLLTIIAGAMLVIGVCLLFTGAGVGLGLALVFGALAAGTAAWKLDDNPITRFFKNAVNTILGLVNGLIDMMNDLFHFTFDGLVIGGVEVIPSFDFRLFTLPKIPLLAEGGFPEQGQMFIAREAGAEMVGNIGRRTAVANNDQIVAGIAGGVAEANEEQNSLLREQNSLLRAILEKESGVYLDGKKLTNSVEKYQRERGRNLITGGVI